MFKVVKTATAVVIMSATFSWAQDTTEDVVVEQERTERIADLNDNWSAACLKFVLSEQAQAACDSGEMPETVKSGERFPNRGVGAEFNTLIRQF